MTGMADHFIPEHFKINMHTSVMLQYAPLEYVAP